VARVFIDTNVLFPFSVMDLMLALTEDGIHDVVWSDDLLDEWERVIVRERHRSADAAAAITATIRQFFADTLEEVLATITRLAASKRRPPMTPVELVDALDRAGVNEFTSLVRSHLT
jgi:AcrR family transcriptional regulator